MIGELVGEGLTAEIYAWTRERALKLYRPGHSPADAKREAWKTKLAAGLGAPAPRVYEEVELDGRFGFVMDRISGSPLVNIEDLGDVEDAATQLAELHARIHSLTAPSELGSQRAKLEADITRADALPDDLRAAALKSLRKLASGDALCHGDLHPFNVMATDDGPVILDWVDATRGCPLADIARTLVIVENGSLHAPDANERRRIKRLISGFNEMYLARYLNISGCRRNEVEAWLAPIAAARLSENVPVEFDALLELVRASL